MTVGITIKCQDGIVLACDSLTTFSRGVPVKRFSNKVYLIEHDGLLHPVAIIAAGMYAFIDKFIDTAKREAIADAYKNFKRKLDIVDFSQMCEPLVGALFKEYAVERNKFFGAPVSDFSLSIIIAGVTADGELRAFFVHPQGLTENIADYGTIGSGAAYAELFLKSLVYDLDQVSTDEAACLSVYAIKGVEIMDHHVGGKTNVMILRVKDGNLVTEHLTPDQVSDKAKDEIEDVLRQMGNNLRELIERKEELINGECLETPG